MTIYALIDPRDESTRYIGKTAQPLEKRLMQHVSLQWATEGKAAWLQSLLDQGLLPTIRALQVVSQDEALRAERQLIREHLASGGDLVNERNIMPDPPEPAYVARERERLAPARVDVASNEPSESDEYMTLKEAAAKIGYKDASGLHHAVQRNLLQTRRIGRMHVTTQEWLDAYMAHVEANRGGRGKARGPRQPKGGE